MTGPPAERTPFGDLLVDYRRRAELTQEALANKSEVGVRTIQQLEDGSTQQPRVDTVRRLADALALSDAERELFRNTARPVTEDPPGETQQELDRLRAENQALTGNVAELSQTLKNAGEEVGRLGSTKLRRTVRRWRVVSLLLLVFLLTIPTILLVTRPFAPEPQAIPPELRAIVVMAPWNEENPPELEMVRKILQAFTEETGVAVGYLAPPQGRKEDYASWYLANAARPDVTLMPQPALMRCAKERGQLQPLPEDVAKAAADNYNESWAGKGEIDGQLYGLAFKVANKSAVWYSPRLFSAAGVDPTKLVNTTKSSWTWKEFLRTVATLNRSSLGPGHALAIGAKDNQWILTDWFENLYARRIAPADEYDQLAQPRLDAWDSQHVLNTLQQIQKLLNSAGPAGDPFGMDRGAALQALLKGKVAMIVGDFAKDFEKKPDIELLPFPSDVPSPPDVFGGDIAVMNRSSAQAVSFLRFLAGPSAAKILTDNGYLSPRMNSEQGRWPQLRAAVVNDPRTAAVFDLSDQLPIEFGSRPGKGMQKALVDLVLGRTDPAGAQQDLVDGLPAAASACPG